MLKKVLSTTNDYSKKWSFGFNYQYRMLAHYTSSTAFPLWKNIFIMIDR